MKIRVLKLGEAATELNNLPEGATVQDAMDALAWQWNGYTVMVNGLTAVGWTQLKDSDVVTMHSKIEGGARVKILKLGERASEVNVPDGKNIGDALETAGFSSSGYSIMRNGSTASTVTPVSDGDIITLTGKIEGGM